MFERLLRELEALKQVKQISVPIGADKHGYLDKECPNEECTFQFKVEQDDWKNLFSDDKVYCPLCKHEAKSDSWFTREQIERAKEQALKNIRGRLDKAIVQDVAAFNSGQSNNGFIKMMASMSGTKPIHIIVPVPSRDEMQLKIQCKACLARYAVIGSAFFCPCCGHNSAEETFDDSLKKIESKIKNLPIIRQAVEAVSKDEAETTCRSLIESSLGECIVAFQRFCEVLFVGKAPGKSFKLNAFQNIDIGSAYWQEVFGETYTDWLTNSEMTRFRLLFQKRHLLAHTEGIVDQKYLDKTNDISYRIGQRIVVKEKDIAEMVELIRIVSAKIRSL